MALRMSSVYKTSFSDIGLTSDIYIHSVNIIPTDYIILYSVTLI